MVHLRSSVFIRVAGAVRHVAGPARHVAIAFASRGGIEWPMASISNPIDVVPEAAAEESAKLRRHFGRFDVFFFLVCTLVGLDTIGSVASNGAQGFTWLIFLAIVFFAP